MRFSQQRLVETSIMVVPTLVFFTIYYHIFLFLYLLLEMFLQFEQCLNYWLVQFLLLVFINSRFINRHKHILTSRVDQSFEVHEYVLEMDKNSRNCFFFDNIDHILIDVSKNRCEQFAFPSKFIVLVVDSDSENISHDNSCY